MSIQLITSNPNWSLENFQTWTQKTHDAILRTGINDASGSGSITYGSDSTAFETLVSPVAYDYSGYQVYKFADALQSTHPVFIKIGYGAGTNVAYPGIHVTVGSTFNDTGSVSGPPVTQTDDMLASAAQNDAVCQYMICGDTNRIIVTGPTWDLEAASKPDEMYFVSVERTKDANGDDTDEGILVAECHQAGTYYWYMMPYIGSTPLRETRWTAMVGLSLSGGTIGGRQVVSPLFPTHGVAPYPGKNILITKDENFMDLDVIPIAIYGDTPNYYFKHPLGNTVEGFSSPAGSGQGVVLQRWD